VRSVHLSRRQPQPTTTFRRRYGPREVTPSPLSRCALTLVYWAGWSVADLWPNLNLRTLTANERKYPTQHVEATYVWVLSNRL